MVTRRQIIDEARSWMGTPFVHQGTAKGVGCDCAGLLRGVSLALGILPDDYRESAKARPFMGYGKRPDGSTLQRGCEAYMDRVARSDMRPGDAILIRWGRDPQHLGVLGDYVHGGLSMIHAMGTLDGRGRVIEHRLDDRMLARFCAAYAFRGLAD